MTLGDTTKRDRADRRLLYLEDAGSQTRDRHDLLEERELLLIDYGVQGIVAAAAGEGCADHLMFQICMSLRPEPQYLQGRCGGRVDMQENRQGLQELGESRKRNLQKESGSTGLLCLWGAGTLPTCLQRLESWALLAVARDI